MMYTDVPMYALLIGIVIVIVLIALWLPRVEGFRNKKEKARAIYDWFAGRQSFAYTDYKREIQGSNIVEYEDMLRLVHEGRLTMDNALTVV